MVSLGAFNGNPSSYIVNVDFIYQTWKIFNRLKLNDL
jgi:hypothetical protein